jgi:hypothetical protein
LQQCGEARESAPRAAYEEYGRVNSHKHQFPQFLSGQCPEKTYYRWLHRKAAAHVRRDRKRGFKNTSVSAYKAAIHRAVEQSRGLDAYTGQPLRWRLLSRYNNAASKAGRTRYKQRFGDLPTIDHVGGRGSRAGFMICAWRTNDAKHDLTYKDFIALCRAVIAHAHRMSRQRRSP